MDIVLQTMNIALQANVIRQVASSIASEVHLILVCHCIYEVSGHELHVNYCEHYIDMAICHH